MTKTNSER